LRIVLDTNVLVAGLLSPFGPCGEIVRMVASAELLLCFDARVLSEYREVLARPKFRLDREEVNVLLDHVERVGQPVAASPLPEPLPDRDDEPFLAVALACPAEALITGNQVHFPVELRKGAQVLTPAGFLEWYRGQSVR
jgi:uncharacterized protein